ncbi:MAG: hypothetical protein WC438_01610 [Candidatus Pacearchaeota archaeon]
MINIKNHDKEKQKISFITDMPISLANAIRRSVLEIPTLAIDEVEIIKNDSALFDEILAHRIGLIPIKTEKSSKEQKFKLKKQGEMVYSSDIKPSVDTPFKLPLTLLEGEQEIELNASAKLGIGLEHIKHSPGLAFYKHNLDEDLLDFVEIEDDKITLNEDELKSKLSEEQISKLKKLKEINEIIFTIESWGQLDVKDIFTKAIEALDKNLTELEKSVK